MIRVIPQADMIVNNACNHVLATNASKHIHTPKKHVHNQPHVYLGAIVLSAAANLPVHRLLPWRTLPSSHFRVRLELDFVSIWAIRFALTCISHDLSYKHQLGN